MSEIDPWLDRLPTIDELESLDDKALIVRINSMIGQLQLEPFASIISALRLTRVQYLTQELARREQDRQTRSMVSLTRTVTGCTIGVTIMTLVIMFATIFPMVHAH